MSTGADLIAAERRRQMTAEGWTPEHDDAHDGEALALAAATYATPAPHRRNGLHAGGEHHEWVHDGRVIAAYGPNPYGLMGQDWTRGWRFDADGRQSATTTGPRESTVRDWFNATPCPGCGHPIGSHDPEDGTCDRHADAGFGVCQCGRGEVPRG